MAAKKSVMYVCENCGSDFAQWLGQCTNCKQWNTIVEQDVSENVTQSILNYDVAKMGGKHTLSRSLDDVNKNAGKEFVRKVTGISELDRVLGGTENNKGLVQGSVILITGEPGIGKSTLLSQFALLQAISATDVTYVSAEESLDQVNLRLQRLLNAYKSEERSTAQSTLQLSHTVLLEDILQIMMSANSPKALIVDSIQAIGSNSVKGIPGGLAQIKYCAAELIIAAKKLGKTLVLVGHVNKEGTIAGPKTLEHMVDVVLHFEGEARSGIRILTSRKNRFGSTDEIGLFAMGPNGLEPLESSTSLLDLTDDGPVVGSVKTIVMEGRRPLVVEVQSLLTKTEFQYPKRVAEGVSLARLQMLIAVASRYLGLKLQDYDIYLNVAGGLKLSDRSADLAIVYALLTSVKKYGVPATGVVYGQVSLSGKVAGDLWDDNRAIEAKRLKLKVLQSPKAVRLVSNLK